MSRALLYDIHGNLAALDAVLAEVAGAKVDGIVLGGDYATFGPWPRETVERLDELRDALWVRGNVDRWLVEDPELPQEARPFANAALDSAREQLSEAQVGRLYGLPAELEADGVLFCHGSPLSDIESFAAEPQEDEERLLAGVGRRTVVFGHSHIQFQRPGPAETHLVNPGSVGQPLDGDRRAAWALLDGGEFRLRRTEYDVERAIAQVQTQGAWAEQIVQRLQRAKAES